MPKQRTLCPVSATPGKPVREMTVRALVEPGRRGDIDAGPWHVCEAPGCPVTYFAPDGRTFSKDDLTVRVGFKETHAPRPVCYCFGHTRESIQEEIRRTGESTAFDSITARIQAGECHCETLNPKGNCCLGDVRAAVQEIIAESANDGCCSSEPSCEVAGSSSAAPDGDCCGSHVSEVRTGTNRKGVRDER